MKKLIVLFCLVVCIGYYTKNKITYWVNNTQSYKYNQYKAGAFVALAYYHTKKAKNNFNQIFK